MSATLKAGSLSAALICLALGATTTTASALSVELARKCSGFTAKAYPPRIPGNPAAGLAHGVGGITAQSYFQNCLANEGKVDEPAPPQ